MSKYQVQSSIPVSSPVQSNLSKLLKSHSWPSLERTTAEQSAKPPRVASTPAITISPAQTPELKGFHIGRKKKEESPLEKYVNSLQRHSDQDGYPKSLYKSKQENNWAPASLEECTLSSSTETVFSFDEDLLGWSSPEDKKDQHNLEPLGNAIGIDES